MSMNIPARGTLKAAKISVETDAGGEGTVLLKIPGTTGTKTRLIEGGTGWFDTHHPDDCVFISVSDEDNILGYGAGVEVGKYYDDEVAEANQGWYIPIDKKVDMRSIADMAHLVAGLYLKIHVQKGDGSQDWFRANIKWGSIE